MTDDRRAEVPALCLGNAVGFAGPSAIPLWVASMIKSGPLSTSQVGWLASGELFLLAMSVLATSAWGKGANPRTIACVGALAVAAANVTAMFPAVEALVMGRLLSGVAMGAVLASVTRVAARRSDAQRVLSLMQAAMVLLVCLFFFIGPDLIEQFGAVGLFAIIAVVAAVMAIVAPLGLPAVAGTAEAGTQASSAVKLAPLLGCLAVAGVFIGQNTVWTYIMTIGNELGFDERSLGKVLAIVPPLAMLGPLAAHRLGERAGLLWPLLCSLVLLASDAVLLVNASSLTSLCVYSDCSIWRRFFSFLMRSLCWVASILPADSPARRPHS